MVAVVGPTATGKSDLALDLAERLGGEVVNADAMQLYRGMDIGTAKLPAAERRGVPHHQLDVLDVTRGGERRGVPARGPRATSTAIRARGRVPLLVGGSGLYVRAALDRLEIPPTDPAVRAAARGGARASVGVDGAARAAAALDPRPRAPIQPNNGRRIVRALEVIELTGRPFSATMPTRETSSPTVWSACGCTAPDLDERIAARVRPHVGRPACWRRSRRLDARGLREGRTAAGPSATARRWRHLDGRLDAAEARRATTIRRPAGSPGGRSRGSAPTRASTGSTYDDAATCVEAGAGAWSPGRASGHNDAR